MNEKNYLIKYAIMPMYEQVGWAHGLHELEREYDIVAYIVAKCYVISKKETYKDKTSIMYEVVFATQECEENYRKVYKRVKPKFNIYNQCINSIFTECIFDNFDDALLICNNQNEKILKKRLMMIILSNKDKLETTREQYNDTINRYKILEQQIKEDTIDLEISKDYDFKISEIIEKVLAKPEEFYTSVASVLSQEEYNFLKGLIEVKTCYNCLNKSCKDNKTCSDNEVINCDKWDNASLVGKQLLLYKK